MDPESAQRNANPVSRTPDGALGFGIGYVVGFATRSLIAGWGRSMKSGWSMFSLSTTGCNSSWRTTKGGPRRLVGCVWDPTGDEHAITDLAVAPQLRRSGIGREAVAATVAWAGHPAAKRWIAFVEVDNPSAFKFFPAIGWCHEGIEDGMHRFCREM